MIFLVMFKFFKLVYCQTTFVTYYQQKTAATSSAPKWKNTPFESWAA